MISILRDAEPLLWFLIGCVVTRILLVPRYCPDCTRKRDWLIEMKRERDAELKKALGSNMSDQTGDRR